MEQKPNLVKNNGQLLFDRLRSKPPKIFSGCLKFSFTIGGFCTSCFSFIFNCPHHGLKVIVHVGTDQNIETEIFTECKYTLNELPDNSFFNISTGNSLRHMANEFLPEVKFLKTCFG